MRARVLDGAQASRGYIHDRVEIREGQNHSEPHPEVRRPLRSTSTWGYSLPLSDMAIPKEEVSAEQVRRMLAAARFQYSRIEAMAPPYPDVRVTAPSGCFAIETTEVHGGVGPSGGSPTRGQEEKALRAGLIHTGWAVADPVPGIGAAVQSKCGKSYELSGDENEFWLVLLGATSSAPRSTMILTVFLDLDRLGSFSNETLAASRFDYCYLFCELTERGPALYGWDRKTFWRQII